MYETDRGFRPMKCSHCRERVDNVEDRGVGEAHCWDEDSGEVTGTLDWDWAWTWRDDDPDMP